MRSGSVAGPAPSRRDHVPDHTARPASSALLGALDVAGVSALARYRAELVAGRRARLIWRAVKALGAGVLIGLLFPLWVAAAAAVIVALGDLGHYYRNGPAASWRKGARGERKTARALAPLAAVGYTVLHDRAIPNSSANIDHIVVGPGGRVGPGQ